MPVINTPPVFGTTSPGGFSVSALPNAADFGSVVLRQPDGRFVVIGRVLNGLQTSSGLPGGDLLASRFNADGTLDASFGQAGRVSISVPPDLTVRAAVQQADGRIVIGGGTIKSGSFYQFALFRINADGSLDTGFDTDGALTTVLGSRTDVLRALALQADGKIVAVGGSASSGFDTSGSRDFALVRYNADGSLDTSFNGDGNSDGRIITAIGPSADEAVSVVIQSDGKILLAGRAAQGAGQSNNDIALVRYNTDGSVDTGFGIGGKLVVALTPGNDVAQAVVLQPDGKILVAGVADRGYGDISTTFALLRFNADGSPDTGFNGDGNTDGRVLTPLGTIQDINYQVLLQPDGKILVCGLSFYDAYRNYGVMLRYNADGSLDTAFGQGGIVRSPFAPPADASYQSMVLLPDGKIVVAGFVGGGVVESYEALLLRYNADGSLDTSFGTGTTDSIGRYTFGAEPVPLAPQATVYDAELAALNGGLGDYGGASLTFGRHGGANLNDRIGLAGGLTAGPGGTVLLDGVAVATATASDGATTVTFLAGTTQAQADSLLQQIGYSNTLASLPPSTLSGVQVDITFSDGNTGAQGEGGAQTAVASAFINLEDPPVLWLDGELVNESDGVASLTFSLSHASTGAVTVDWATADGTGTAPGDYTAVARGTLTFLPGETSKVVTVDIVNDTATEGLEVVFVLLSHPVGATLGDMGGAFGIAPSDAATVALPAISAPPVTSGEDETVEFFVSLSAPSDQTVTVDYATSAGTAGSTDYVAVAGTLSFAPGQTLQRVRVQTNADGFSESTESFTLTLSNASHASIATPQVTAWLFDDDSQASAGVTLNGTDGADLLVGSWLADTLLGGGGADLLIGEEGSDSLAGGIGDDTYLVDDAVDVVNEAAAEGSDTVISGLANYTLPANVENLVLAPPAGNATGNDLANQLVGNAGKNQLSGGGGNDTLLGGGDADTLTGGGGNDVLDGGAITDRINYGDWNVLTYQSASNGVSVDLSGLTGNGSTGSGTASDGNGGTDSLVNLNVLIGSEFADTITGSAALIFEQFEGRAGNDTIDGGAIDAATQANGNRASYANATGPVTVNLGTGIAIDGMGGTDTLLRINQVRGSSLTDTLTGSDTTLVTEHFEGRGGNDTIDGKGGTDLVRYDNATAAVVVNLVTGTASDGQGGTDTLLHLEGIRGSAFSDSLIGGNLANGSGAADGFEFFIGGAGNDTIDGGAGYDRADYTSSTGGVNVVLGGAGNGTAADGLGGFDTLIGIEAVRGSEFDDLLVGSAGALFESFEGRGGDDSIAGLGGTDRVDYVSAPAAVIVNLFVSAAHDGYGGTDTLAGIEDARGSSFDDSLVGDGGDNALDGGAGNDTIQAGGGQDTLTGGAGDDSLNGGDHNDLQGHDWVSYSGAAGPVNVNLLTGSVSGHGNDTVAGIEGVIGTASADTMLGDSGTNLLRGNGGNDTLDGGAGGDWADYRDASGSVTVDLATGSASGADGADVLSNIERISGSAHADQLTGDAADNWLAGNGGDDTLGGGGGLDLADYSDAPGAVSVNLATGTASGAHGNDLLVSIEGALGSTEGDDTLVGDNGDNLLDGRGGADSISGGGGNDTLIGGPGNDTLDGGTGIDVAVFNAGFARHLFRRGDNPGEVLIFGEGLDLLTGIEVLQFNDRRFSYQRGEEAADTLGGSTGEDLIDGGGGNDSIDAGEGSDAVYGDEGNDSLSGGLGDGADTLDGGTGDDSMAGGAGDDEYAVDSPGDQVLESGGAVAAARSPDEPPRAADNISGGIDKVVASINYTLAAFVENLELAGGAGGITGGGNELANELLGNESDNSVAGAAGNDTLTGAGGNDTIDGGADSDRAIFAGNRGDYLLATVTGGYSAGDQTSGRDGNDTIRNVETLVFADRTVDLTMGSRVQGVSAADLKTLEEIYVGFFNRVPEAEGLGYWIGQLKAGTSLTAIANQFYDAGVQFGVYSPSFTDQQFVAQVYDYVLGRGPNSTNPPPQADIDYWVAYLNDPLHPAQTKGTMVLQMLSDTHTYFETGPFAYVAQHLNNKAFVANYYAVQQGLSMIVQDDNISFGMALAQLITPTDTSAAIAFIGVNDFSML